MRGSLPPEAVAARNFSTASAAFPESIRLRAAARSVGVSMGRAGGLCASAPLTPATATTSIAAKTRRGLSTPMSAAFLQGVDLIRRQVLPDFLAAVRPPDVEA